MNTSGIRCPVAVVHDHIGPYHRARLEALSRAIDVDVLEVGSQSPQYSWDEQRPTSAVRWRTLTGAGASPKDEARAVVSALDVSRPRTVFVPGWGRHFARATLYWAVRHRVPAVMVSDTQPIDSVQTHWRTLFKRRLLRLCAAAFVAGTPHRKHLCRLGMDAARITLGYDAVDNEHFRRGSAAARADPQASSKMFGLPDAYFLCVARFVPEKNLEVLIEAFARYRSRARSKRWDLVLVGYGPLREAVEARAERLGVGASVRVLGKVGYDSLPAVYGLAGAYIQPSRSESWGLAVNEAMAAGLPVLVSNRCGCASDLVAWGENGFTFGAFEVDALAALMDRLASSAELRERFGRNSQETIARWGLNRYVQGAVGACRIAQHERAPRRRLADATMIRLSLEFSVQLRGPLSRSGEGSPR